MAERVTELVFESNCTNCLVWAKSAEFIQLMHQNSDKIQLGFVLATEDDVRNFHSSQIYYAKVCGVNYDLLNDELQRSIIDQGYEIYLWTLDDPKFCTLQDCSGVTAIVTNNPSAFIQYFWTQKRHRFDFSEHEEL
eukprot:TRINITY_DN10318_c0_g1_i2.p4 TRINITY_DN10318_c0_g1~~TRINITY_DN10318_c0_g1_i2.p4  ORF type:complete len:136 (+),score=17.83 TRINITY_DN10318_c0_g1_i2:486-893(+)